MCLPGKRPRWQGFSVLARSPPDSAPRSDRQQDARPAPGGRRRSPSSLPAQRQAWQSPHDEGAVDRLDAHLAVATGAPQQDLLRAGYVCRSLEGVKLEVEARAGHELPMRTFLDDTSFLHHVDPVR